MRNTARNILIGFTAVLAIFTATTVAIAAMPVKTSIEAPTAQEINERRNALQEINERRGVIGRAEMRCSDSCDAVSCGCCG